MQSELLNRGNNLSVELNTLLEGVIGLQQGVADPLSM